MVSWKHCNLYLAPTVNRGANWVGLLLPVFGRRTFTSWQNVILSLDWNTCACNMHTFWLRLREPPGGTSAEHVCMQHAHILAPPTRTAGWYLRVRQCQKSASSQST
ncbi:unnamed protein product [Acanthoscelides obtectus]|uniref:Uncharacterized protein n=1 Tax=Acanthoscelides obtectus TaxID=200917 RepID=A0A9P0KAA2_ACAOB|nr:unnamed protein product [Acanthoscelides obtectus]CAK1628480.1 hypothetical protein AOBTE_LOCUS5238 [Acanthoscelides obtectus]